ncbi:2,3-bisphosphoglycerate-independent phosphoglycerate mutase-like [Leishmania major strain Friedlin]|uniref:2,3-bisphosphoglycerate-independent phosphoglycerate mutase-like n=1 Tax=Leishmania major TaxID=5664 RepID=Q4Q842_LEIMA|nr:2,3-bisphosphoglycerate-independent phosphoglycerate mutase-like [Leishmania major strain Friedlin]CAG9577335.1 2_-3-bisphosphoglycerate-independent_phosphoglycerate_mutase-like [Leishmania major strain Friedlin]CAJ05677.1 2,3-bisphosphoglycerate-independent phosphoglycerate mutase-like [Leishmania major strain Friedlin]|eukprot:XP_001684506.1 2,3-bisphosphoglycerate-independent phosphoglycerate mutase-like [Leishmania major strain Friedlin]
MTTVCYLIFVCGTLQRGENNYPYWLADEAEAVFVARARTVSRYPFFVNLLPDHPGCLPCVLDLPDCNVPGCAQVEGEVFSVSAKMKAWLDVLEDISGGTHVSVPTLVELCEAPSASFRARGGTTAASLKWPAAVDGEAVTVAAALYFRAKGYPDDWSSPTPRSSSRLVSKFSAASMLRLYGDRFNGGVPAHLRADGNYAKATAMQTELNALPEAHWPPSTIAYYAAAAKARMAQSDGEHVSATPPPIPCYGAPLFPKPMILFIIDGIGDNTYCELGGRTPLEVVAGVPAVSQRAPSPATEPPTAQSLSVMEGVLADSANAALRETLNEHVTPGINVVSRHGVSGLMDPYMAGKSCGSDTAHLSIFGYPPTMYYRGRGAYEALGAGLELEEEDVAFKCNFSTFADRTEELCGDEDPAMEATALSLASSADQYVTHRRCDRDFTVEGPVLCNDLNGTKVAADLHGIPFDYPHTIKMQYATEHRCGVALSGARRVVRADGSTELLGMLSDKITGTDPLMDRRLLLHCKPTVEKGHPEYAAAVYTCRLVEAASAALTRRLKVHPVNEARRQHNRAVAARIANESGRGGSETMTRKNLANLLLFRGAAKKGWVPTFAVRHGLHGLILAPTCIIKGLGICCGLRGEVCRACDPTGQESLRGATGDYHSDLIVKVRAVLHALRIECPSSHEAAVTAAVQSKAMTAPQAGRIIDPHYNFVVVHVKGVDNAGHDKSLQLKLEMLRRSGWAMEALWRELPAGATMAVIADHSTPLGIGDHCCEPVPVSVAVKRTTSEGALSACPADGVEYYSEVKAASGGLGRFRGEDLIPLMKRVHHSYHYV